MQWLKDGLWSRSGKKHKKNEKYLKEFQKWLEEKNLSNKTVRKHVGNARLFINDYLTYYDVIKA